MNHGRGIGEAMSGSLHQFDLTRPPFLGEERFERAVEAQDHEPTFLRIGLDPVAALHAVGLGRAEIDRRGGVAIKLLWVPAMTEFRRRTAGASHLVRVRARRS